MAAKHRDPRAACWQIAPRFGNLLCHRAAWQFGGWLLNKCGRCRIWNFKKNKTRRTLSRDASCPWNHSVNVTHGHLSRCVLTPALRHDRRDKEPSDAKKKKKNPSESQISLSKMSEHRANGRQPRSLRVAEGEVGRGREIGEVLCWVSIRGTSQGLYTALSHVLEGIASRFQAGTTIKQNGHYKEGNFPLVLQTASDSLRLWSSFKRNGGSGCGSDRFSTLIEPFRPNVKPLSLKLNLQLFSGAKNEEKLNKIPEFNSIVGLIPWDIWNTLWDTVCTLHHWVL